MNRQTNIEISIADIRRSLVAAKAQHATVSLQLVQDPSSAAAKELLSSIESEMAEYERHISRLESAKIEAARLDSDQARRKEVGTLKEERKQLEKQMDRQFALAREIVAAVEPLGVLLAEFHSLASLNREQAFSIVKRAAGGDAKLAHRYFDALSDRARGMNLERFMANALSEARMGALGTPGRPFISVERQSVKRKDIGASYAEDKAHTFDALDGLIAKREDALYGRKKDNEAPTVADRFIEGGKKAQDAKQRALGEAGAD